jgi:hypothetical protein
MLEIDFHNSYFDLVHIDIDTSYIECVPHTYTNTSAAFDKIISEINKTISYYSTFYNTNKN